MEGREFFNFCSDLNIVWAIYRKKVLKDLEARCNYRNTTYVQNDSNGTAFEEGKRTVYLHILNMLEEDTNERNRTTGNPN